MRHNAVSIRPFIGAKDFELSGQFYIDLGFQKTSIDKSLSYFHSDGIGFYLQDAYVKDWIDNTMAFMEVEDVDRFWEDLVALDLTSKYERVKLTPSASCHGEKSVSYTTRPAFFGTLVNSAGKLTCPSRGASISFPSRASDEPQVDFERWIEGCYFASLHRGGGCDGKTPMRTFRDAEHVAKKEMLDTTQLTTAVT